MGNMCLNPTEEDPPPPPQELMPLPDPPHDDGAAPAAAAPQEAPNPINQGSTGHDDFPYEFLYLSEDSPTNQAGPSGGGGGARQTTGSASPAAVAILRADLLASFECPFQMPCATAHCPFGHQGTFLRPIPSYFCLDHLMMGHCGAQATSGIQDELPRCEMGFHATVQDLTDLDVFVQKLSSAILVRDMLEPGPTKKALAPQPVEVEESDDPNGTTSTKDPCGICLDPIPQSGAQLGYLENCFHCFHAGCLLGWRDQKHAAGATPDLVDCPTCRLDSSRILFWPCEFASEDDKKTTFHLQKECLGLMVEPESSTLVRQMPNGQFLVVVNGTGFMLSTPSPNGTTQQQK